MNGSENIDKQIASYTDWRGKVYSRLRQIIKETAPELNEDWKWDSPVYTKDGNVCSMCAFKDHVKINFFKGAQIADPEKIFNNGLESKNSRSIDFFEGDKINEPALKELIKTAVKNNQK